MKVLVTGATGFLGSKLARRLAAEGHSVRVLCRPTSDLSDLHGLELDLAKGDVTDSNSVESACTGVDSVFHLAGLIAYTRAERERMENINVQGTANVIAACEKKKIRRLVHMSSVVAVGASFDGKQPLNEDSPYNMGPYNFGYSETKRAAEKLVVDAVKSGRIDATILNPSTIYGPGDAKKGSRKTQLKVAQGKFKFYTPGGVNVVSVDDVTVATVTAWRQGRPGERYILAGENVTIRELFGLIAEFAEVPAPKWYLPKTVLLAMGQVGAMLEWRGKRVSFNSESAHMSVLFHWFDSAKAQRELGLKVTPARISIGASVKWMSEQGYLKK